MRSICRDLRLSPPQSPKFGATIVIAVLPDRRRSACSSCRPSPAASPAARMAETWSGSTQGMVDTLVRGMGDRTGHRPARVAASAQIRRRCAPAETADVWREFPQRPVLFTKCLPPGRAPGYLTHGTRGANSEKRVPWARSDRTSMRWPSSSRARRTTNSPSPNPSQGVRSRR
jgi:hypothetical protein